MYSILLSYIIIKFLKNDTVNLINKSKIGGTKKKSGQDQFFRAPAAAFVVAIPAIFLNRLSDKVHIS